MLTSSSSVPISALLIEDDERLARLTMDYFALHGVQTTHVADGEQGTSEALRKPWDVIVLDLMLPGRDGLSVCRAVRERSDVPVVMITARTEEADRVLGLELGADDYVSKPYSPRELLARVRAVVRRHRGEAGPPARELRVGELVVQIGSRRATFRGKDLGLTTYEFDLLFALAQRAGRVLSREQLLELIRGNAEDAFDRSIDVHVSRLRGKLGEAGALVRTVRGAGYMLADSP